MLPRGQERESGSRFPLREIQIRVLKLGKFRKCRQGEGRRGASRPDFWHYSVASSQEGLRDKVSIRGPYELASPSITTGKPKFSPSCEWGSRCESRWAGADWTQFPETCPCSRIVILRQREKWLAVYAIKAGRGCAVAGGIRVGHIFGDFPVGSGPHGEGIQRRGAPDPGSGTKKLRAKFSRGKDRGKIVAPGLHMELCLHPSGKGGCGGPAGWHPSEPSAEKYTPRARIRRTVAAGRRVGA